MFWPWCELSPAPMAVNVTLDWYGGTVNVSAPTVWYTHEGPMVKTWGFNPAP